MTAARPFRRSAWAFLALALVCLVVLGTLELLGARECTVVLSGGTPDGRPFEIAALMGGFYTVAWLAAVALAPPFAMAGLVLVALGLGRRRAARDVSMRSA